MYIQSIRATVAAATTDADGAGVTWQAPAPAPEPEAPSRAGAGAQARGARAVVVTAAECRRMPPSSSSSSSSSSSPSRFSRLSSSSLASAPSSSHFGGGPAKVSKDIEGVAAFGGLMGASSTFQIPANNKRIGFVMFCRATFCGLRGAKILESRSAPRGLGWRATPLQGRREGAKITARRAALGAMREDEVLVLALSVGYAARSGARSSPVLPSPPDASEMRCDLPTPSAPAPRGRPP